MAPHVNLSSFLHESSGHFFDPLHGHSFHRVALAELTAVQHSRLFFRDCLVCQQRVLTLTLGRPSRRRGSIPQQALHKPLSAQQQPCLFPTTAAVAATDLPPRRASTASVSSINGTNPATAEGDAICQCLDCGNYAHRECVSLCHSHRYCRRGHEELLPFCPQIRKRSHPQQRDVLSDGSSINASGSQRATTIKRKSSSSSVTISSLIDELSEDTRPASQNRQDQGPPIKPTTTATTTTTTAATVARRIAPFLAAGGVIGAIALGPAGAALAGLNLLITGVGVEGVVAGLSVTAATAAASANHQLKKKHEQKRRQNETATGAWAMEICWHVKQQFKASSLGSDDDKFRTDAALLRRFQLPRRPATTATATDTATASDQQFAPTKDDVYLILFGIFSSSTEFLSHVNAALGKAFMERYHARVKRSSMKVVVCKETLQDAKMYVAHLVGATMQGFPSLASTDAAVVSCSQAIERIIFDDVYKTVISTLDDLFENENALFYASLEEIRRQQRHRDQSSITTTTDPETGSSSTTTAPSSDLKSLLMVDEHLQDAERQLVQMMEKAFSPLHKLELLCGAFRSLCCFADKLHRTAANADILIPIVCALLIASSAFQPCKNDVKKANFVSQIAFTSFFTDGGGKGVEGYVLTTFQAALQVIAAVDLSQGGGHAKELDFFIQEPSSSSSSSDKNSQEEKNEAEREREGDSATTTEDDDQDEYFDAITSG